jgi:phosphate transport system substrate-binding protein
MKLCGKHPKLSTLQFLCLAAFFCLPILDAGATLARAVEINGGGATFPAIMYQSWIARFRDRMPDVNVRYEPIGSGEGWARFATGKVDFAASETIVPPAIVETFEGVLQAPLTAGMIVLAYNLPGLKTALKLPRKVMADIFLGNIDSWDDPRIVAANPGLVLPAARIAPIVRGDSSGTTHAFTKHLAAVSPAWREGPGVGKIVRWPATAIATRGNEGVAYTIKSHEGAIGYIQFEYARRLGLQVASLENKEGFFVAPSAESGSAALDASSGAGLDQLANSLIDPAGPNAYPIVTYSWIMLRRYYRADQAPALKQFVSYALGEGQSLAVGNGYLALPPHAAAFARNVLALVNSEATRSVSALTTAPKPPATTVNVAESVPTQKSPPKSTESAENANYYRAHAHETLRDIAVKFYKDPDYWALIWFVNRDIDPKRRLHVGQILRLP